MLRKLTSLLFREEEIVIEEEHDIESVGIPSVKPLQTKVEAVDTQESIMTQKTQESQEPSLYSTQSPTVETQQPKKSFRIDLDGSSQQTAPKPIQEPVREVRKESSKPYVTQEILSPIHGGSQLQNEPLKTAKPVTNVKKRTPLTEVISPMYGKVEEPEVKEGESLDLSILELDVESMITPEYHQPSSTEEVQTSLFDYLEGDESSES